MVKHGFRFYGPEELESEESCGLFLLAPGPSECSLGPEPFFHPLVSSNKMALQITFIKFILKVDVCLGAVHAR